MAGIGKSEENRYAEQPMLDIKEAGRSEFTDMDNTRQQIEQFLEDVHMTMHRHSALKYLTLAKFEARATVVIDPLTRCLFYPTFQIHYTPECHNGEIKMRMQLLNRFSWGKIDIDKIRS